MSVCEAPRSGTAAEGLRHEGFDLRAGARDGSRLLLSPCRPPARHSSATAGPFLARRAHPVAAVIVQLAGEERIGDWHFLLVLSAQMIRKHAGPGPISLGHDRIVKAFVGLALMGDPPE